MLQIIDLAVYPIKSCGGLHVPHFYMTPQGAEFDRQWMIVDSDGNFLTQRKFPKMSMIKTQVDSEGLSISLGKNFFRVQLNNGNKAKEKTVKIWEDEVQAICEPQIFSDLISQFLEVQAHLVRYNSDCPRALRPESRFADQKPVLILNENSVIELKKQLDLKGINLSLENLIERFRPNIVLRGLPAFAEENLKKIFIEGLEFDSISPCARCGIINVDQTKGQIETSILKTLSSFRLNHGKIFFGIHATPRGSGHISLESEVKYEI